MGATALYTGGVTPKEKKFIDLYLFGSPEEMGNASECYQKVFNPKVKRPTVWVYACELLKRERVRERIKELTNAVITDDFVKNSILKETTNAEKTGDRLRGYELLGKSIGMFRDNVEIDVRIDTFAMPKTVEGTAVERRKELVE